MQVSSATVALTLLKGPQAAAAAAASQKPFVAPATKFEPTLMGAEDREMMAKMKEYEAKAILGAQVYEMFKAADRDSAIMAEARDGLLSPFDPKLSGGMKVAYDLAKTDPRMEFPGGFFGVANVSKMGETAAVVRDAPIVDRRAAMAVAYHFGIELARDSRNVVSGLASLTADQRDAQGNIYGISSSGHFQQTEEAYKAKTKHDTFNLVHNMQAMERSAASLSQFFSFDNSPVTHAAYDGKTSGISISHATYGKIMDISEDGRVTLYDAEGNAFGAEDYNAANPDATIPELENHLIIQAERQAGLDAHLAFRMSQGKDNTNWATKIHLGA